MNPAEVAQSQPHCQRCRYYRPHENGHGSCHRFPPVFAGDASPKEIHHWKFPLVYEHGWCGELSFD